MISKLTGPIALAAILLLSEFSSAPAQAPRPWRHGVIEPKGDAGFIMMVGQNGIAEKRGLKLEIVPLKNGATAHKALLSGELDSIESSPGATILAGAHGADIRIVGCDWPGVPHGLLVRSNITSVADLKGKTIAVAAPGSLPNLLINAILEKYKIAPADVRFANLGGDLERYKAVLAGVVDAGVVAVEFMSIAPKDVTMLVEGYDVMPDYVRLCLTVTGKTLAERHDDAINFIAAEIDALHYAISHRAETVKLTQDTIQSKPDDPRPAYAYDETIKHHAIDPDASLPLAKLNWLQGELVKAGNLSAPIDLAKITAPDVLAEALKRAGK